jgi:O-antigen/teichoic acid export membrane protein
MSDNVTPLRESGAVEAAANVPAPTPAPMPINIRARAISGTKWTMGGFAAANVMRLAGNVIVGHILGRADPFGVMQLANAFLQGVTMLSDVGIGPNIIQSKRGEDSAFLNTAWTVQVIRGIILWLILLGMAYPVSQYYGQKSLLYIIPMIGLTALFSGFNGTAIYTLNKRLNVRDLTLMQLASQFAGVGVMIIVAFLTMDIIALALAGIVQALVKLFISHRVDRSHTNRFQWDKESLRSLLGFGSVVFVSTALTFAGQQGDKFILAKQISMEQFGLYTVALMISRIPLDVILNLGTGVAFPAYSHAINSGRNLKDIFHKVRFPLCTAGAFAMAGVATTGPDIVRLIWAEAFHGGARYIPILCVSAMFQILELTSGQALLALGKVKYLAIGNALRVLALIAGLIIGFQVNGFWGALVGMIAADAVRYLTSAFFARREGLPIFRHDFLLFALTIAAYYGAVFVQDLLPDMTTTWMEHVVRVLVGGAVVTAIFAWPLSLIAREFFSRQRTSPMPT